METSLRLALATLATALSPLAFAHASLVASFPARDAVLTSLMWQ
jgi:methionine-rich copper-binding protein CopC